MSSSLPDLDWYLDNVVLARGPDGRSGPAREWRAGWDARARELAVQGDAAIAIALNQGFVLTRSQARASGRPDAEVRRLVYGGAWSAPRHGVVAAVPATDDARPALEATAAALVRPGHVISHRSAAEPDPSCGAPRCPATTSARGSALPSRRFLAR
ncbi:MAG TPA: hypothetical protein VGL39_00455 [Jatrophihabitantaceae bacterium]